MCATGEDSQLWSAVGAPVFYEARSAARILSLEARTAGRNPPSKPMITENMIAFRAISGESANLDANPEKVVKPVVER